MEHKAKEVIAKDYLKFCRLSKVNPVSCSKEELTDLLKKFSKKNFEVLEMVDRLHDPVDGEPIIKNLNFQKIFGIVQMVRKPDENSSSELSSRERKTSNESISESLETRKRRSAEAEAGNGKNAKRRATSRGKNYKNNIFCNK